MCQRINEIIKTSSHLQYQIELHIAGCVDNPFCTSTSTTPERLAFLIDWVRYWKKLDWDHTSTYTLKFDGRIAWRICGGLSVRFTTDSPFYGELPRFEFIDLTDRHPAPVSQDQMSRDTREAIVNFPFILDPGRDILFVVRDEGLSTYLDVLRLSNGSPYSDCRNPRIRLDGFPAGEDCNFGQVKNELISIHCHSSPQVIVNFDWMNGQEVDRLESSDFMSSSFQIINHQYYVAATLVASDPTSESEVCIAIGSFGQKRPVVILRLLELYDDWFIESAMCYTYGYSEARSGIALPFRKPFGPSVQEELFGFHFLLNCLRPATHTSTVVIGPGMALSLANTYNGSALVDWKDWGPNHTRCFLDLNISNSGDEFEEESAFAKVSYNRLLTTSDILDFNQLDIARDVCRGQIGGIVCEPSSIPSETPSDGRADFGVFVQPVISRLPYRKTPHRIQAEEDLLFTRFMLEEHLMTQNVNPDLDWTIIVYH